MLSTAHLTPKPLCPLCFTSAPSFSFPTPTQLGAKLYTALLHPDCALSHPPPVSDDSDSEPELSSEPRGVVGGVKVASARQAMAFGSTMGRAQSHVGGSKHRAAREAQAAVEAARRKQRRRRRARRRRRKAAAAAAAAPGVTWTEMLRAWHEGGLPCWHGRDGEGVELQIALGGIWHPAFILEVERPWGQGMGSGHGSTNMSARGSSGEVVLPPPHPPLPDGGRARRPQRRQLSIRSRAVANSVAVHAAAQQPTMAGDWRSVSEPGTVQAACVGSAVVTGHDGEGDVLGPQGGEQGTGWDSCGAHSDGGSQSEREGGGLACHDGDQLRGSYDGSCGWGGEGKGWHEGDGSDMVSLRRGEWWSAVVADAFVMHYDSATRLQRRLQKFLERVGGHCGVLCYAVLWGCGAVRPVFDAPCPPTHRLGCWPP